MALSKDSLRLLTLNTHSHQEADTAFCLNELALAVEQEQLDILALQEVNQGIDSPLASPDRLANSGFVYYDSPIKADNWALLLAEKLATQGQHWHWTWTLAHVGYPGWHEGIALFSKSPILDISSIDCSVPDRSDVKISRRKILAIHTAWGSFISAHTGWWSDPIDPFAKQWEKLDPFASSLKKPCWLLGDCNCPSSSRGEGYDLMLQSGWQDCYTRAQVKDAGFTIEQQIDGWRDREVQGLRLDLCLAAQAGETLSSHVIFNDSFYKKISDHYGVLTVESLRNKD